MKRYLIPLLGFLSFSANAQTAPNGGFYVSPFPLNIGIIPFTPTNGTQDNLQDFLSGNTSVPAITFNASNGNLPITSGSGISEIGGTQISILGGAGDLIASGGVFHGGSMKASSTTGTSYLRNDGIVGSGDQISINLCATTTVGTSCSLVNTMTLNSAGLSVTALTNSSQSNALCYNSSTGAITYNSGVTTCLASTMRVKDLKYKISPEEGLDIVMALQPWDYIKKGDPKEEDQTGLLCEQVEKIDPRLAAQDEKGRCNGVKYEQAVAVLVAAIQKLDAEVIKLQRNGK